MTQLFPIIGHYESVEWPTRKTGRIWMAVVAVCVLVLLSLGLAVGGTSEARPWEEPFGPDEMGGKWERSPDHLVLQIMRAPGEPWVFACAVFGLSAVALYRRDHRLFVVCTFAAPAAVFWTDLALKPLFDRSHGVGLAYPSGHSTSAAALAFTGWLVVRRLFGPRAARCALPIAIAVPACCGVAVVLLRYHYPADVVGGWAVGLAVSALWSTRLLMRR